MSTRAGVCSEPAKAESVRTMLRPSLKTGMTMSSSATMRLPLPACGEHEGRKARHEREREQPCVEEVVDRQQQPCARGCDVAIRETGKVLGADREAGILKDARNIARKNGPLVRGDAERAVERGGMIAIEPHERIHAVRVKCDEAPAGPQNAKDFGRTGGRIGEMMHHAA